jgi:RHS repeat-associated protein
VKPAIDAAQRRFVVYDPDMKLLAETEFSSNWAKALSYEYVYLGDRPLAQVDVTTTPATTYWLGTDHLGTPFLRTLADRSIDWRVEHEPYGRIFSLRGTTAKHMPLRFPGQEAEQLTTETNGVSEKSYNIFRWYHPSWGRYSQVDPGEGSWWIHPQPYPYAWDSPNRWFDRLGLYSVDSSCNSAPFGTLATGIRDACDRVKPGTKCFDALRNIGAAMGSDLPGCMRKSCTEPSPVAPLLRCGCIADCGRAQGTAFGTVITIGRGEAPGCPAARGLGFGETIFHETLHHCAFGQPADATGDSPDEPHRAGPRAAWFRYAEKACFDWRSPFAPPVGPPNR